MIGLTTTTMHPTQVQASPSDCPHPGQCTCNAASGVMTDHAMVDSDGNLLPGAQINNGCTEPDLSNVLFYFNTVRLS